jgi:hypothetical protein
MIKDEALKMAIDTLQNAKPRHFYCEDTYYSCPKHEDGCADDRQPYKCNCGADELNAEIDISINACKEALEQPEGKEFFERGKEIAQWADKQVQEPVAYIKNIGDEGIISFSEICDEGAYPVYTHPYQWQGLTDDEIVSKWNEHFVGNTFKGIEYYRAIEQALKDKNG